MSKAQRNYDINVAIDSITPSLPAGVSMGLTVGAQNRLTVNLTADGECLENLTPGEIANIANAVPRISTGNHVVEVTIINSGTGEASLYGVATLHKISKS